MNTRADLRGQPVIALLVLLGGWAALRATLWESPFVEAVLEMPERLLTEVGRFTQDEHVEGTGPTFERRASGMPSWSPLVKEPVVEETPVLLPPASFDLPDPLRPKLVPFEQAAPLPQRLAAAHNMLLVAGLSNIPLPPELAGLLVPKPASQGTPYRPLSTFAASPDGGRWSADGWVLLRQDTATALTSGRGSYGGSQAGAVLRYSLAPSSRFRPVAYTRVSQALGGSNESELALGLSARPVPALPLRAAAEVRVMKAEGRTYVRPAAFVVTEIAPVALPFGFTSEVYGQAGYVGGKYTSPFVDGQIRAERAVFDLGDATLSAGGGAWGGAQKGAARLDIGPTASVSLKLGETNSRVSMDYRFRVAGEARPSSGPALTISAGF